MYLHENETQTSVLYEAEVVGEQSMYHNSASHGSLCKGKEWEKKTYMSLLFMNYRNWKHHAADYLFGSYRQVSVRFLRLRPWTFGCDRF